MRQILLLFFTILLFNYTHAQPVANNTPIPTALYGEWYDISDGQIKLAIYDNMIMYQKSQWFLDTIESSDKNHYILKLKGHAHKKIFMDFNGENPIVYDQMGSTLNLTKNIEQCKIKHNLARVKEQPFKKNSIWFQCYYEDPNVYPSKQRVTITTYDYIRNKTSYNFQFISKENSVAFQLPVNGPTVINVSFSSGRKQQFYMLPGEQLIELITKDRGIKYMGDAAALNEEMRLVKNNYLIFPNSSQLLNPYNLTPESIQQINPEKYSQIVKEKKVKARSVLKSLYTKKEISPLTYQIERLNIEYSYANFMLHYNKNMANAFTQFQLPYNKQELQQPYFVFLKGLDNKLGTLAPAYKDFISYMTDNSGNTDYFPALNKDSVDQASYSIDDIIDVIAPIEDKNKILSKEEQSLFDSISQLNGNENEHAQFLTRNRTAIKEAIDNYSYLVKILTISKSITKYTQTNFNWHPGTLTDLCIIGNIVNQALSVRIAIPDYFFKPGSGYFANPFIAKNLLELKSENKDPNIKSPNPNSIQNIETLKADWSTIDQSKVKLKQIFNRDGLELTFISYDSNFSLLTKGKMTETFFKVYPKQLVKYNSAAPKHVTFIIDPAYTGVAATSDSLTRFNPKWFLSHPNDIDVVTHEVMHIVQGYPYSINRPSWITEGIADYVRLKMGLYNDESNWTIPAYNSNQRPQDSYRVTAGFFNWLEQHKKQNIVRDLDQVMRKNKYDKSFWDQETNESLDQLWNDYAKFSAN